MSHPYLSAFKEPPVRERMSRESEFSLSNGYPYPQQNHPTDSLFDSNSEPSREFPSTTMQPPISTTTLSLGGGSNSDFNVSSRPTVSTWQFDTRSPHEMVTTFTGIGNYQVYREPPWSGTPPEGFYFEMIKQGVVLSQHHIRNPYLLIGRLTGCDIHLEHPSISRYHAILQYCDGDEDIPPGFYLYDLGSTHGTFVNKAPINPNAYFKMKVGHVVKFGMSTRIFVLQGPETEEEEEEPEIEQISIPSPSTCNWGIGEDAVEDNVTENPFALPVSSDNLDISDPKKTLRRWYEREGYELEYKVEERNGNFICSVRLPVDSPSGEGLIVEGAPTRKKKEAVADCALESCRVLDRFSLLRRSQHESHQRKKKKWEDDDYYDSDEDPFLDRTGMLEKKREWRRKMNRKLPAETRESIERKIKNINDQIEEIDAKFENSRERTLNERIADEMDPLDSYMTQLHEMQRVPLDPVTVSRMRSDLAELKKQKRDLEQLRDATASSCAQSYDPSQITEPPQASFEFNAQRRAQVEPNTTGMDLNGNCLIATPFGNLNPCSSRFNPIDLMPPPREEPVIETIDLASTDVDVIDLTDDQEETAACSKRSAPVSLPKKAKKKALQKPIFDAENEGSSGYSTWLPPSNQSGDGSTYLNNKYGY